MYNFVYILQFKNYYFNHGLRTPNEAFFFSSKFQTFGLGLTIWADKVWGIWGIFQKLYQHPFWYCESLVHVFHQSTIISTKTKPLYPNPKYLFGIGIWIWIWAEKNEEFSHRVSVVRGFNQSKIGTTLVFMSFVTIFWDLILGWY